MLNNENRFVLPPQDHFLLPAGLLVLQRVPAVSGLRSQAETAAAGAALHHFCHLPPGNLPEAAVGPAAAAPGPSQHVSRHMHRLCRDEPCEDELEGSAQTWSVGPVALELNREVVGNIHGRITLMLQIKTYIPSAYTALKSG